MIAWFTRNDVAANLLMITIAITGLYSLFNTIPLEFFPSFESNRISVRVPLRGATPEDAELGLATRVEEAVKNLEGVEEYTSRSYEGGTTVTIEVQKSYDPRELLDEVKNRVDAINTFPADAERPIISLAQFEREVISVFLGGDVTEREIREMGEQMREELLRIPGITHVELSGIRDYEIAIEVSQDKLREFDLSLRQVANAISNSSLDLSGGNISSEGGDVLIRSKGQAYRQEEFERIVLKTNPDGTLLLLSDVANVKDGFEEKAVLTRYNGKLAATLDVFRVGDQSAIEVADKVKAYVDERRLTMPKGISLDYWSDRSRNITKRIATLTRNAWQGGLLVIILLSLFLRPAVAFWVCLGIPVSFMGAFLVMPFLGVTLNMISLFAFIVVLGIVVDDAIVTGENVYRHMQRTDSGLDAAINGTKEVAVPVTFGVLTTVVAFLPLGVMEGNRGPLFAQIPLIVIPVLLFSLIESKLVLPAHLKHVKLKKASEQNAFQRVQRSISEGFERSILQFYQPTLKYCLNNKALTIVTFVGILVCIIAAAIFGHTRYTFFPRIPSEFVRLTLVMPSGTPFEVTDRHMQHILKAAQTIQQKYIDEETGESIVLYTMVTTGGRGNASHIGSARFQLIPPEERSLKTKSQDIAREWRRLVGNIPGAEEISLRAEIGRSSDPIDIQLRSNNLSELERLSEKVKERLGTYSGVFDIKDSLSSGKEELRIELKPEAHILGISRSDIIQQVRQAFFGLQAQRIQRGRDDIRVMVRFPKEERKSVAYLNNMLISTSRGQQIPLSQLATLTPAISPTEINRINGYRTVNVIADIDKDVVNMTAISSDLKVFLEETVVQYPGVTYKFGGEQEEQEQSFNSMMWGAVAVMFVIYCLLAIPFKSYVQPFIVMSIIPFGAIGAMLGHWIMGMTVTIMSIMGLLALSGVLINDSLVLVDYINKLRERGKSLNEAVLEAGAARFRPVMLTSLTTFFGLLPLLFEKETQAQFLIPMAISLGFGIIFATFITLLLVPINYLLIERARSAVRSYFAELLGRDKDEKFKSV